MTETSNENEVKYAILGGPDYAIPTWGENEWFDTLEGALNEWARRRNDWTGRYPCWGDAMSHRDVDAPDGNADPIIILGNEVETLDGWSLERALSDLDRSDEIGNYLDLCGDVVRVGDTWHSCSVLMQHDGPHIDHDTGATWDDDMHEHETAAVM